MADLQEIEAIKRHKYRYMRCIDEKCWDELAECFAENASVAFSGGQYSFAGRDAIMKFLVDSMDRDSFFSSHRVGQPEIELTSDTTATGIWALDDTVIEEPSVRIVEVHGQRAPAILHGERSVDPDHGATVRVGKMREPLEQPAREASNARVDHIHPDAGQMVQSDLDGRQGEVVDGPVLERRLVVGHVVPVALH